MGWGCKKRSNVGLESCTSSLGGVRAGREKRKPEHDGWTPAITTDGSTIGAGTSGEMHGGKIASQWARSEEWIEKRKRFTSMRFRDPRPDVCGALTCTQSPHWEQVKADNESKKPLECWPTWPTQSLRNEGTSNVAERWINVYCAIGRKYMDRIGEI